MEMMFIVTLKPHNEKTYNNLLTLFEKNNKIAIVQPTGSGKSFIIFKLCEDNPDKKVVIFVPNRYIEKRVSAQASEYGITNLHFMTYQKLIRMTDRETRHLQADFVVFDEMHRIKAPIWEKAAKKIFKVHTDIKYIGMTATPDRMDGKNPLRMFYKELACNMSLGDAIVNGILPTPTYISALYSIIENVKINYSSIPFEAKNRIISLADEALSDYETNSGISTILKKHIPNKNGKYIVFCSSIKQLRIVKPYVIKWFKAADFKVIDYEIHTQNAERDKAFKAFDKNKSRCIRLLFCVDMLSEGVHLDNISGVILLRPTKSKILYFQQIGRAIDANGNDHPLIFDFVDNASALGASSLKQEVIGAVDRNNSDFDINAFEVYNYTLFRTSITKQIINSVLAWDKNFRDYLHYVDEYGDGNVPLFFRNYKFWGLDRWCSEQRGYFKRGELSKLKIKLLNENMFVWDI